MVMISNYKIFKFIAIVLGIIVFSWLVYDFVVGYKKINEDYVKANDSFLKKDYIKALNLYEKVSKLEPENLYAIEGQARSLMRLKRFDESEKTFRSVLSIDDSFVPALTNIAILYDTIGEYKKAVTYYKKALKQDDRAAKRMSWFNRFLKNIQFKPTTIKERLFYLEGQLRIDDEKRILKKKNIDELQPDHQM